VSPPALVRVEVLVGDYLANLVRHSRPRRGWGVRRGGAVAGADI